MSVFERVYIAIASFSLMAQLAGLYIQFNQLSNLPSIEQSNASVMQVEAEVK